MTERKIIKNMLGDLPSKQYAISELREVIHRCMKEVHDINEAATSIQIIHIVADYIYEDNSKYFFNTKQKTDKKQENIEILSALFDDVPKPEIEQISDGEMERFINPPKFIYPTVEFEPVQRTEDQYGPYGTQWIHTQPQTHDKLDSNAIRRAKQFDTLRKIILPEQRSPGWFAMREGAITASDGGCVVDVNHYEPQYKFILKKTTKVPFLSNSACYHGKKLEQIATSIYEYRMNVVVEEFGLLAHPTIPFLAASPDGICGHTKADKKSKSKFVGRMLEIKCPVSREIKTSGEIYGGICPEYYWVQVQLQLECCDLDECDFWQCKLYEYPGRDEFIADTNVLEPFRSTTSGFEKGCLIQLMPKARVGETIDNAKAYWDIVYEDTSFIYPPKIEMTPLECDIWIAEQMNIISTDPKYYNKRVFDKVLYWRLDKSHNVTIQRDREWFAEKLPVFEQMWGYVTFLRANPDKLALLTRYIESRTRKVNTDIMQVIDQICTPSAPKYNLLMKKIEKKIADAKVEEINDDENTGIVIATCGFLSSDDEKPAPKKKIVK